MMATGGCHACNLARKKYKDTLTEPELFIVHVNAAIISQSLRKCVEKQEKLKEVQKIVSALRNTKGGDVLIHLNGQNTGDSYLGHFDDFLDASLQKLIPDGRNFTDVYTRYWLREKSGFEDCPCIVLLNVVQSTHVTTLDFKTKICSDFKVEKPTTLHVLSLLQLQNGGFRDPLIRTLKNHEHALHENRNIQLKSYKSAECPQVRTLVDYIWSDLKFKHYLCSMSKVCEGGSYFLGVQEKLDTDQKYESKTISLVGFNFTFHEAEFEECLFRKINEEASMLNHNGQLSDVPRNLLSVAFHIVGNSSKKIIEIAIGYTDCILFYDRRGPETYTIEKGEIQRMPLSEWFGKMQKKCHLCRV